MTASFLLSALAALSSPAAFTQETARESPPVTVARSIEHRVASAAVSDTFLIQVRLPASYISSPVTYPVLYVLDADKSFGLVADSTDWLAWAKEIPEVIVVGIAYGRGQDDWWQKRSRDYTPTKDRSKLWGEWPLAGGAERFQEFLARELFPFVERHYRARADDRAIVGLSFGGLFGAFSLFTRPSLFQKYILISPAFAWDEKRLWEYEAQYRSKASRLSAVVFSAVGDRDENAIVDPWREFTRLVEGRRYEGLRWVSFAFPDETHISVLSGAVARGLKLIYAQ